VNSTATDTVEAEKAISFPPLFLKRKAHSAASYNSHESAASSKALLAACLISSAHPDAPRRGSKSVSRQTNRHVRCVCAHSV